MQCWLLSLTIVFGGAAGRLLRVPARQADGDSTSQRAVSLKLENHKDLLFSAKVTIGRQSFPAVFDSGSFETLVLSKHCSKCTNIGVPVYDNTSSSTFRNGGTRAKLHGFGSGPVICEQDFETVEVGDSESPLKALGVPFWQVLDHDLSVWHQRPATVSAIVGLGMTDRVPDQFERHSDKTLLSMLGVEQYGLCLEEGRGASGVLTFNPVFNPSGFIRVKVVGEVHWGLKLTDMRLGPNDNDPCKPSCGAIVDSGTSLIAAPVESINELAPTLNLIKDDCSNVNELPDLSFRLGGQTFTLPPELYVVEIMNPTSEAQGGLPWKCYPGFIALDMYSQFGPTWVLGLPFLRKYHAIFDRTGPNMFFAETSGECASTNAGGGYSPLFVNRRGNASRTRTRIDLNSTRLPPWAHASNAFRM